MENFNKNNNNPQYIRFSGEISEDKESRRERREERKRERLEKKFGDSNVGSSTYDISTGEGDFNLKAFSKAIEGLKNEVIAQLTDCDLQINSGSSGKKAATEYKPKFYSIFQRISKMRGEISYRIEKEGKRLEADDEADKKLIKTYRENYNSLLNDLKDTTNNYNSASADSVEEYLQDQKYKDVAEKVLDAEKIFDEAKKMMSDNQIEIQLKYNQTDDKKDDKKEDEKTLSTSLKSFFPIKSSDTKKGDQIIKVKKLIYQKFKKDDKLKNDSDFKIVFKNEDKVGSSFKANTKALIKKIKSNLGIKDNTSDITEEFIKKLEEVKESVETNNRLLTFDDFLNMRKK